MDGEIIYKKKTTIFLSAEKVINVLLDSYNYYKPLLNVNMILLGGMEVGRLITGSYDYICFHLKYFRNDPGPL